MQVLPPPVGVQALAGALDSAAIRQQVGATKTDSPRAVSAATKSDNSQTSDLRTRRDPENEDGSKPKPRGSLVDIRV